MKTFRLLSVAAAFAATTQFAFAGDCNGKAGWSLMIDPMMPAIGDDVMFDMTGPANEMGALMFSLGQGPNDSSYGTVCLDFPLIYIEFFSLDSNGNGSVDESIPCDFDLRCIDVYCQFITCAPNKGISNQATISIADAICSDGWMVSFTQAEWDTVSDGVGNIGYRRDKLFNVVFPSGVTIGDSTLDGAPNGYALHFTSPSAITAFLPQTGACGQLTADATDPTSCAGGALAGEMLAAHLNIGFDDALGFNDLKFRTDVQMGDLVLSGAAYASPLVGMTGRALVSLGDQVLSGALGAGPYDIDGDSIPDVTVVDIYNAVVAFNGAFDNGSPAGNLAFP